MIIIIQYKEFYIKYKIIFQININKKYNIKIYRYLIICFEETI